MRRITTVISGDSKYEICENEHGFWAIEQGYIKDGKLAKPINGIQGHLRDDFMETVRAAIMDGKFRAYLSRNPDANQEEQLRYMMTLISA